MRRPFVRRYEEERELTVMLVVDLSGSERFGTARRFKGELAVELAAVLALAAVRNNDRVGLVLFTDRVEHVVRPRKGRRHALRLLRDLLAAEPVGTGTRVGAAAEYVGKLLGPQSRSSSLKLRLRRPRARAPVPSSGSTPARTCGRTPNDVVDPGEPHAHRKWGGLAWRLWLGSPASVHPGKRRGSTGRIKENTADARVRARLSALREEGTPSGGRAGETESEKSARPAVPPATLDRLGARVAPLDLRVPCGSRASLPACSSPSGRMSGER
jgi:hypothetical protein